MTTSIIIRGINYTNHATLHMIAGNYGYGASVRIVDDCARKIELVGSTMKDRQEFCTMIGDFMMSGFTVDVVR